MDPLAPARPRVSAIEAAQQAITLTGQRLFPFRLERWLPLGVVAMLDQCGRGGGGSFNVPGGGGGGGGDAGAMGGGAGDEVSQAIEWVQEHLLVIALGGCAVFLLVAALVALVTFLRSRGTFMYIDDVATGRFDIVRPWREHADKAWSFFGWSFGIAIAGFLVVVALLVPIVWSILTLIRSGASALPIVTIVACVLLVIALAIGLGLFGVLLRDFAAPLQLRLGVATGPALRVAWGLVRTYPLTFLGYLGLKIVFGIAMAICAILAGCFTCCLGFLPVIAQTILQPLLYFERGWSLMILRQAGYDLFPPAPPPVPPAAPPPGMPPGGEWQPGTA
jgi:hypothetical protein